jgi:hypothetical protein
MATRLAEIYRSEKKTGGGLASSIGKSLKEKIDPRQMLDQSGLLVSMFPSLKSFNATRGKGVAEKVSSNVGGGIDNSVLNTLAATSSLTAKNTMTLPMMARDMNLMKLNIFKLVKLQGGSANTGKTDIFFKNAKDRETAYENTIGKIAGKGMIGKMAKSSFVGKQNRDGQSPGSALFVTGGDETGLIGGVFESLGKSAAIARMATLAGAVVSSPLFLTAAAVGSIFLAKKLRDDEIASDPEKYKNVPSERAKKEGVTNKTAGARNAAEARTGLQTLTRGTADDILNYLTTGKIIGQPATDNAIDGIVKGAKIADVLAVASDSAKAPYLKMVADNTPKQPTPAPSPTPTVLPTSPAGAGRGFVNPENVSPTPETQSDIPSNVIRSGSGAPIMTGSGGYVTSGESPSPVSSSTSTGPKPPSPTPMGSELGKLSARFESAKDGPGAIGYDSTGGTSYGTYQIASKTGTMSQFLAFLDKNNPDLANQLRNAGDPNTGSRKGPFPDVWKKIASEDPKGFDKLQHDFIQKTHYDPAAKALMKLGFNINEQSDAMKDVLWSTSVQHGSSGAVGIFSKAIKELGVSASPEKLINRIYQERGTKFASSTEGVQKSVLNRFSEESKMAVASLNSPTQSTPSVTPSSPSSGSAVASTSTSVADGKMAAMTPSGGNTNVINKPTTVASNESSPGGKASTAYDNELFQTLVGYQSA